MLYILQDLTRISAFVNTHIMMLHFNREPISIAVPVIREHLAAIKDNKPNSGVVIDCDETIDAFMGLDPLLNIALMMHLPQRGREITFLEGDQVLSLSSMPVLEDRFTGDQCLIHLFVGTVTIRCGLTDFYVKD